MWRGVAANPTTPCVLALAWLIVHIITNLKLTQLLASSTTVRCSASASPSPSASYIPHFNDDVTVRGTSSGATCATLQASFVATTAIDEYVPVPRFP
jgi:hypothetical protein